MPGARVTAETFLPWRNVEGGLVVPWLELMHLFKWLKQSGGPLLPKHNDSGCQGRLDYAASGAVVAWMGKGQAQRTESRQDNEQ